MFDYWKDPDGHEFEHYADGDVYAWGQDMPKSMLKPNREQILGIVKGLLNGSISIGWLETVRPTLSRSARPWL